MKTTSSRQIHQVRSLEELHELCTSISERNPGQYILAYVIFGEATVFTLDRLPGSHYTSDDYRLGYWLNGRHFHWSEARKHRARRAYDKLSGVQ
jgi:hypothetical protein